MTSTVFGVLARGLRVRPRPLMTGRNFSVSTAINTFKFNSGHDESFITYPGFHIQVNLIIYFMNEVVKYYPL